MSYLGALVPLAWSSLLAAAPGNNDPGAGPLGQMDKLAESLAEKDPLLSTILGFGVLGFLGLITGVCLISIFSAWLVSLIFAREMATVGRAFVLQLLSVAMYILCVIAIFLVTMVGMFVVGDGVGMQFLTGLCGIAAFYFIGIWPWQKVYDLGFFGGLLSYISQCIIAAIMLVGAWIVVTPIFVTALVKAVDKNTAEHQAPGTPAATPATPTALRMEVQRMYAELQQIRATLNSSDAAAVAEFNKRAAAYAALKARADAENAAGSAAPSPAPAPPAVPAN